jgi:HEAT repeat protein
MLWWKLQRLKSRDAKTRCRMIEEVAGSGDLTALEPVADALADEVPEVRIAAAKALGAFHDDRVLPPLVSAIKDRNAEVRAAAIFSLRRLGDAGAIDALVNALADYHHAVRWQAAGALSTMGWRPSNNIEFVLRAVATCQHEDAAVHGAEAVEALTSALEDPTCPRRNAAAIALGKTGDARAVPPLENALNDADSHVRVAAVEALSLIGHPQSATALLKLLQDTDHLVRATAIESLGRMGEPRIVEYIAASLIHDTSWDVRKLSVEALGRIKDEAATQLLWVALKDPDHDVRQTAATSLGQIPDPKSIGPLVLALKDENSAVRQAAKGSLRQIDRQWEISPGAQSAIPELEAAINDREYWVAQSAADTLAKINDMRQRMLETTFFTNPAKDKHRQALTVLVDSLRDFDRDFRQAAVEALGRIGDVNAVAPLVSALDDQDEWVGRAAALALNHLNWEPPPEDVRRAEKIKSLMLRT